MAKIFISDRYFSYSVNHKSVKNLSLRLNSRNSFIINCPYFTPQIIINSFIKKNADWIIKNSAKFRRSLKFSQLNSLSILGFDFLLIFNQSLQDSVVIYESDRKIYINSTSLTSSHLKKLLDTKLRSFALKLIKNKLSELSVKYGFKYGRVSVRNQKSRFGSCSSRGNLNFNWQIILFPNDKFEHILLHELNHLAIKDHSSKFWQQLSVYDPQAKANNLWLKKLGSKSLIFS